MYGLVNKAIEGLVRSNHGDAVWREIVQQAGDHGNVPDLDLRPTMADVNDHRDPSTGRANAWRLGDNGRVIGLEPYPGGLPGLFAEHVGGLTLEDVHIRRPDSLPAGWASRTMRYGTGVSVTDAADPAAGPR